AIGQNYTIALELYHKAAAQHNEDAYLYLGRMYENGMGVTKDYAKAYEYFAKAKIAHVLSYLPDYPCDIYKDPD
ncbi:sel1 repeat family protein, partial [Proteus mirabilis]